MNHNYGVKKGGATEALFKSGIQTLNTGMKLKDRDLLGIAQKQLELAANEGYVMAEFFKQIIDIRLAQNPNKIDFKRITSALFEILNDPDLENMFLSFLISFKETLESAEAAGIIKLLPDEEAPDGTIDEILKMLKNFSAVKNVDSGDAAGDTETTGTNIIRELSRLYLCVNKFFRAVTGSNQISK